MATITDIRSVSRGSQRRRLFVDGDEWRAVPDIVARDLALDAGQDHDLAVLDAALLEAEHTRAWERALRLLDYRERGSEELRRRLADDGYRDAVVDDALARATELGFLADERFADMLARSLAEGRLLGRARVALALRAKGVDEDVIDAALERCCDPDGELDRARRLAVRLVRTCRGEPRRLAARLVAKGYSNEFAWRVARETCRDASGDAGAGE